MGAARSTATPGTSCWSGRPSNRRRSYTSARPAAGGPSRTRRRPRSTAGRVRACRPPPRPTPRPCRRPRFRRPRNRRLRKLARAKGLNSARTVASPWVPRRTRAPIAATISRPPAPPSAWRWMPILSCRLKHRRHRIPGSRAAARRWSSDDTWKMRTGGLRRPGPPQGPWSPPRCVPFP